MRQPPLKTRLYGHPLIVMAMTGATVWSIVAWVQGGSGWLVLIATVALSGVLKASERRLAYQTFRREWESFAPPAALASTSSARRSGTIAFVLLLAVLLAAGSACYIGVSADQPDDAMALVGIMCAAVVMLVLTGVIAAVRATARAFARRRRAHDAVRDETVEVCVTRPLLPALSLTDAYRALPAYCWKILS